MPIIINGKNIPLDNSGIKFNNNTIKRVIVNDALVWPYTPPTMEECSWEYIGELARSGSFPYPLGSTKTFAINGKTYTAELVSINEGAINIPNYDGSLLAPYYPEGTLDFITKELYVEPHQYNDDGTATARQCWPDSDIRTWMNSTVYDLLPSDLRNNIITKMHKYQNGYRNGSYWESVMTEVSDALWLPTAYELLGESRGWNVGEYEENNKKYEMDALIKSLDSPTKPEPGIYYYWFTSSPYGSTNAQVGAVNNVTGTVSGTRVSKSQYIPICFRIG